MDAISAKDHQLHPDEPAGLAAADSERNLGQYTDCRKEGARPA
jgi:hypothetical protein